MRLLVNNIGNSRQGASDKQEGSGNNIFSEKKGDDERIAEQSRVLVFISLIFCLPDG